MIVTVAAFKGGVGKTTTAIHLAAFLQQSAPTLLVDGDLNRSALGWQTRGALPFRVVDERQAARYGRDYEHVVIDTEARPKQDDLKALAGGCDLLVVPTTPEIMSLNALLMTVEALEDLGSAAYRVLLTIVPPRPSRDGDEARETMTKQGLPVFGTEIRRLVAFQKASLAGRPVHEINDPRAREAWAEYESVGREIQESVR